MPISKTIRGSRYFDWLNLTKDYFRFLGGQGVALPSFGTRLQWNQFFNYVQGNLYPRNLAAYYPNDPNAIILDSSGNVQLWADKSGNSNVNVLAVNAVGGNYASTPDAVALHVTGDLDVRLDIALSDYTPSALGYLIGRDAQFGANRSWFFYLQAGGALDFGWSADGTTTLEAVSTISLPTSDFGRIWIRATLDVDNGAGGNDTKFYTSPDGVTWTQLGTTVTKVGTTSIFAGTQLLTINSNSGGNTTLAGLYYRAQIYNGIAGTLVFDADFTAQSKLATAFLESSSNAATVTVNTTGDTGARICGARDLYQGTAANRPAYTGPNGNTRLFMTFDGSNDYLKTVPFSLSQPETVYFVGSQVGWTIGDNLYDGNANGTMILTQQTVTPVLSIYAGNSNVAGVSVTLNERGIISSVFNGASSSNRLNRTTPSTGNPGGNNANGFTLASLGGVGNWGNITVSEITIYSEAHNTVTQNNIISYFATKFGIPL